MSNVRCQQSNIKFQMSIKLIFGPSVPPEFLRSFYCLVGDGDGEVGINPTHFGILNNHPNKTPQQTKKITRCFSAPNSFLFPKPNIYLKQKFHSQIGKYIQQKLTNVYSAKLRKYIQQKSRNIHSRN